MILESLSAIAARSEAAAAVLEKYRIDYYCCGRRSLSDACKEHGLSPEQVEGEIANAVQASLGNAVNWNSARLSELIRHIVSTHHAFLKLEIPRLGRSLGETLELHRARAAGAATRVEKVFRNFARELDLHMQKEEAVLFPLIERYEAAVTTAVSLPALPFGSIRNPIAMMEAEHTDSATDLRDIRESMREIVPPQDTPETVKQLFDYLGALETDLHVHIHLENNILFPRAIAMETR